MKACDCWASAPAGISALFEYLPISMQPPTMNLVLIVAAYDILHCNQMLITYDCTCHLTEMKASETFKSYKKSSDNIMTFHGWKCIRLPSALRSLLILSLRILIFFLPMSFRLSLLILRPRLLFQLSSLFFPAIPQILAVDFEFKPPHVYASAGDDLRP